ncbi:MAG: hypothetical protein JNK60_20800 [Acidobacteria bacterium]|nr:hypothetical protein [Acidobacteriota bacterium]
MNITHRSLAAAALLAALAAPSAVRAEEQKTASEQVPCWGVNACKGLGDCGAAGCRQSGCHGSNACRRKGFLRLEKETCLRIANGRLTKAPGKAAGSAKNG